MNRRTFLKAAGVGAVSSSRMAGTPGPPNIVLILADDLGYADVGCYGSHIRTPNVNRIASEGAIFRQFCSASPVCSPSRAGLMTGRYGVRVGVPNVLSPLDTTGLSSQETTIPQILRPAGYRSSCVGKWHLGSRAGMLPTQRGFDEFKGLLFSNDQGPCTLMDGADVVDPNAPLDSLTQWYTTQAVDFIRRSKGSPFFLYMAHTAPHVPLVSSSAFRRKSRAGVYGDVVQELDWSVGQVLAELTANGLDDNTLVIFTSDNGPWFQGATGRMRGRKGDTFEGGMRVPFVARHKSVIPAGLEVNGFASLLDILPTFSAITGAGTPARPLDGVNILPMLTGAADSVDRPPFLYFDSLNLQCVRVGKWKLHMSRYNIPAFLPEPRSGRLNLRLTSPELYDIDSDPAESTDESGDYPDVVDSIRTAVNWMLPTFPLDVQYAWAATQTRGVVPNQPGVWPEPIL